MIIDVESRARQNGIGCPHYQVINLSIKSYGKMNIYTYISLLSYVIFVTCYIIH